MGRRPSPLEDGHIIVCDIRKLCGSGPFTLDHSQAQLQPGRVYGIILLSVVWSQSRWSCPELQPPRELSFFFFFSPKGGLENQRVGRLAGDEALVAAVGSGLVGSSCIWERRRGGRNHGPGWG